jgi:hypothetical protein
LLHKTVLSGEGLKMAVAGRPAPIKLALSDEYNNASSPEVGLAITISILKGARINLINGRVGPPIQFIFAINF